jgi:hypothetical protein
LRARIVWRGGDTITFDISVAIGSLKRLTCARTLTSRTLALHAVGLLEVKIARRLSEEGYRSLRRVCVLESTVRRIIWARNEGAAQIHCAQLRSRRIGGHQIGTK